MEKGSRLITPQGMVGVDDLDIDGAMLFDDMAYTEAQCYDIENILKKNKRGPVTLTSKERRSILEIVWEMAYNCRETQINLLSEAARRKYRTVEDF